MSYQYEVEKPQLFTDKGQRKFLLIRDASQKLLKEAGAFRMQELMMAPGVIGDTWQTTACVDRLVELREIVELPRDCWGQYRVFTTPQVHNH